MKGTVLHFDYASGDGVISGNDGQHYHFVSDSWKSADESPKKGMSVDFVAQGKVAEDIYFIDSAALIKKDTRYKNNSGSKDFFGNTTPVPDEIKEWNWGAFLMSFFWSIGNRFWWGLFCLTPYAGFAVSVLLGIKGNEMAWKAKRWESIEEFKSVQRTWAIASFIFTGIVFILIFLLIFIAVIVES